MHLKSQSISARVENSIAIIELTQVFMNTLDSPVDATYRFPTDPDGNTVVSRLLFELGTKTVEAKVMAK